MYNILTLHESNNKIIIITLRTREAGMTSKGSVFSPDFTCERSAPFARGWRRSECPGGGERRKPRVGNVTCRVRNATKNRHRGCNTIILYWTEKTTTTTTRIIYYCFTVFFLYPTNIFKNIDINVRWGNIILF